jgi:hypothetical protein
VSGNVPRIDLHAQERAGGHTIDRHVGKDALWLSNRLAADPVIRVASSFPDVQTAEHHVTAAVQANLAPLQHWLANGSRAVQAFDYDAGFTVGYGVVRGVPGVRSMTKVRLVIRRLSGQPNGCFVYTAFPSL